MMATISEPKQMAPRSYLRMAARDLRCQIAQGVGERASERGGTTDGEGPEGGAREGAGSARPRAAERGHDGREALRREPPLLRRARDGDDDDVREDLHRPEVEQHDREPRDRLVLLALGRVVVALDLEVRAKLGETEDERVAAREREHQERDDEEHVVVLHDLARDRERPAR